MRQVFSKLWSDDQGALIATEFLFVATILVIGIIVGLSAVRDAVNTELAELGTAILALSQGYAISGQSGCCAETDGSQAIDFPGEGLDPVCTAPSIPSIIDIDACN